MQRLAKETLMLKLLRNKKVSKKIFYVLAALIIPAFVIWGSASVMDKKKGPGIAGRIFGEKVSIDQFQEAYRNWGIQLRYQYGDKAKEAAAFLNPLQATWERLIVLHEIKKRNIWVTDKEVVDHIRKIPFLQRSGRFDKQAYDLFLKYTLGVNARQFEETLRENLAMAKFSAEVTKDISVTDEEVREEYEKENVSTRVRYVAFPYDGYKDGVTVTEEDMKRFYATSREDLRVPPQINTNYIGLDLEDEKETGRTREELQKTMQEALQSARRQGLKLTAQELGFELKETGFFGFEDPIPEFGWLPQLSKILFDLPVLSFSKIVQTSRGMYIFQIVEKKEAYIPDLKEAAGRITEILTEQKSKEAARAKAETLLEAVREQGASLEEAAAQAGAEVKETEEFTREAYVSELGMAPALKEAAFTLKEGEVAEDVIASEQAFLVVQSLLTPEINEELFEEKKDAFRDKVLKEKRNAAFNEYFLALRERSRVENYIDPDTFR